MHNAFWVQDNSLTWPPSSSCLPTASAMWGANSPASTQASCVAPQEALPERFGSNSLHGSQPEWQWPDSTMDHGLTGPSLFLEPRHLDIPTDRMASLHSSQPGSLPARASFDSPLPGKASKHCFSMAGLHLLWAFTPPAASLPRK